jgi:hypothetical protein
VLIGALVWAANVRSARSDMATPESVRQGIDDGLARFRASLREAGVQREAGAGAP